MPTFKICVFENKVRKDGKYRVSIRLTHNRNSVYIKTDLYVTRQQISKRFGAIKNPDIARRLDRSILEYEDLLFRKFGSSMSKYTAKELVDYIAKYKATEGGAGIDFVEFARVHIQRLKEEGRETYAQNFESAIRALMDFFGTETVNIRQITTKSLKEFERFLMSPRKMLRTNQLGKTVEIKRPGVKEQTVADYITKLQIIFNAACDEYNDEEADSALITHNPFRKYKIEITTEPEKRNISVEDLRKIIDYTGSDGRIGLARDAFLISFYLLGMNTADIFSLPSSSLSDGRITYKRQKTRDRRRDEAEFSIKIQPEIEPLLARRADPTNKRVFNFYRHYSNYRTFNTAINKGLKQLAAALEIKAPLSSYYARHTVATIAANKCDISESDVGVLLNHIGSGIDKAEARRIKVTRGYIGRDWSKIDRYHRQILDYVVGVEANANDK